MIDGAPSPITKLRNDTWTLIYNSNDELFHYQLYEWLYSQGGLHADRLLDINSPHVLGYLTHRGAESLEHCELLWQYHSRRERFFEAAEVLHELALSEFKLPLEKRLEFFSRARAFCNSSYGGASRRHMNDLGQKIQEELDVAIIQDDLLKRLREDIRISNDKKAKLEARLGEKILDLSDVGPPLSPLSPLSTNSAPPSSLITLPRPTPTTTSVSPSSKPPSTAAPPTSGNAGRC